MRALTVQQPWASAMFTSDPDFWKDVENRSWDTKYRGELAIHAGARVSERGMESPLTRRAIDVALRQPMSAIIGVIDLVGTHPAHDGCCDSPWGEQAYVEHGGTTRRDIFHWENANPRRLEEPVLCRGRLGVWTPANDVVDQVREQLGVTW